eukprot:gene9168-10121_t
MSDLITSKLLLLAQCALQLEEQTSVKDSPTTDPAVSDQPDSNPPNTPVELQEGRDLCQSLINLREGGEEDRSASDEEVMTCTFITPPRESKTQLKKRMNAEVESLPGDPVKINKYYKDRSVVEGRRRLHKCKVESCTSEVMSSCAQYCSAHRTTRPCEMVGCNKCAQGATKFCIAHGGGRRCTFPGCMKGARDKLFCASHGGGRRCSQEGCNRSAVGPMGLCTAHGGGKRCQFEGCTKSSQSNTSFCVRHGGGRSCLVPGCTKVARGKTEYCAAHGGGIRCQAPNCPKIALGTDRLCRAHSRMSKANEEKCADSIASEISSSTKSRTRSFDLDDYSLSTNDGRSSPFEEEEEEEEEVYCCKRLRVL